MSEITISWSRLPTDNKDDLGFTVAYKREKRNVQVVNLNW